MNAAKESEKKAKLQAAKAPSNQEIVTETKSDIYEIYSGIQTLQEDITEKHQDINDKAITINTQYEAVQNYYQNFITGCEYKEFTSDLQTTNEEGTTSEGWVKTPDIEDEYTLTLGWGGEAILNIQIYDAENQQYYITNFADIILSSTEITIKAISPFAGRIMYHALIEAPEVTNNGTTN